MNSIMKWFMPEAVSTVAGEVDALFYFLFLVSTFFFLLIVALMVYFVVKYRRVDRDKVGFTSGVAENHKLETAWTVIPSILLVITFIWGFRVFMDLSVAPKDAYQIKVTGQKWFWTFDYPNGANSVGELVVPVGKPVELLLSSKDVIHSFFVPAFRTKMDALPNRYTVIWFTATKEGEYPALCTEFCGTSHSNMLATVKVVSQPDFAKWLEESEVAGQGMSPVEYGASVFKKNACFTCHSLDGTPGVGPTFKGIYGTQEKLTSGSSVLVDENYIRESILDPGAKITAGYQPVMPTYQGILKDKQIEALIAYMKSLKD